MKRSYLLYVLTFVAAGVGLIFQLLIAQTLTLLDGNSVLKYSFIIGIYLLAAGIGAIFPTRKTRNPQGNFLLKIELLISFFGLLVIPLLYFSYIIKYYFFLYPGNINFFSGPFFISVGILLAFIIGLFKGIEFTALVNLSKEHEPSSFSTILSFDYFGALLAAMLFPLILIPNFSLFQICFLIAVINLIFVYFFICLLFRTSGGLYLYFGGFLLLILAIFLFKAGSFEQFFLKKIYYPPYQISFSTIFSLPTDFPEVKRYLSPYQVIDVVDTKIKKDGLTPIEIYNQDLPVFVQYSNKLKIYPNFPWNYALHLNGSFQSFSGTEELASEYLVHVPIIANQVPRRVLIIGGGNGNTTREVLKYPQIEEIIQVELDPVMIKLAQEDEIFTKINNNAMNNKRLKIVIDDGFNYIKKNRTKFDAIFIDIPAPNNYDLSRLYSREFFGLIRNRLNPEGYVSFIATDIFNSWDKYYNTLTVAGFQTVIPYFSSLEVDNPKALSVLDYLLSDIIAQGYQIESKNFLSDFLRNKFSNAFIFIKTEPYLLNQSYQNNNVFFSVLNERRYYLAFDYNYIGFNLEKIIDPKKVNSIMRPTLYK